MRSLLAIIFMFAVSPVHAADGGTPPCRPGVSSAWLRMAPAAMPMGAAFLTIENRCGRDVVIVGVESADFGSTSLHETRIEAGVSRMRALPQLPVAAGGRVEFKPGGLHIMLMNPRHNLRLGDTVVMIFRLRDGGAFTASIPLRDTAP